MYISSFRIENFKSFLDTGTVNLTPGFNVIVGQNNVGKTALIQALSRTGGHVPHRSTKTAPSSTIINSMPSSVTLTLALSNEELIDILPTSMPNLFLRAPSADLHHIQQRLNQAETMLNNSEEHCLEAKVSNNSLESSRFLGEATGSESTVQAALVEVTPTPKLRLRLVNVQSISSNSLLSAQLGSLLLSRVYTFQAERLNIAAAPMAPQSNLSPDASNLAQVLHYLRNYNGAGFDRYKQAVRQVFPTIKEITIPPVNENQAQIYTWSLEAQTERMDLAVPLGQSGTGIGQVLAMLYVVLTSTFPRVIIIDEPQSFLHPGAVRKLFEVMKQYPEHQYIITTHSTAAITAADPRTMLIVRKDEEESRIESVDVGQAEHLRMSLEEVGARLSDVFGYDNILWVEGKTEEEAFPLIVSGVLKQPLLGTRILGVLAVGDFRRKDVDRVVRIYEQLGQGNALFPPALGFIFDREDRSDREQADLVKQSRDRLSFTPRRMYENYLLNPQVIAAILSQLLETSIATEEVEQWLDEHRWQTEFMGRSISEGERTDELWLRDVQGHKILDAIFRKFSDSTYSYLDAKAEYGKMLTEWLVEHTPDDLNEIAELIREKLLQQDR